MQRYEYDCEFGTLTKEVRFIAMCDHCGEAILSTEEKIFQVFDMFMHEECCNEWVRENMREVEDYEY